MRKTAKRTAPAIALGLLSLALAFFIWENLGRHRTAPHVFESEACKKSYLELFGSEPVELRMVFGYKDARPARFVGDRYEKSLFVQEILKPCVEGHGRACGFERSAEDADLFFRAVSGPDGTPKLVRLRVVQSSAGADDELNRKNPFQKWRSEYAKNSFMDGLRNADAIFYEGHSRSGGGPDFDPPRLTLRKKVDMPSYRRYPEGVRRMEEALQPGARARVIGLFSCDSSPLFASRLLREKGQRRGVIVSDQLIYYMDAVRGSLAALSALLEMKCQPGFDGALSAGAGQAGLRMRGFLKNDGEIKRRGPRS